MDWRTRVKTDVESEHRARQELPALSPALELPPTELAARSLERGYEEDEESDGSRSPNRRFRVVDGHVLTLRVEPNGASVRLVSVELRRGSLRAELSLAPDGGHRLLGHWRDFPAGLRSMLAGDIETIFSASTKLRLPASELTLFGAIHQGVPGAPRSSVRCLQCGHRVADFLSVSVRGGAGPEPQQGGTAQKQWDDEAMSLGHLHLDCAREHEPALLAEALARTPWAAREPRLDPYRVAQASLSREGGLTRCHTCRRAIPKQAWRVAGLADGPVHVDCARGLDEAATQRALAACAEYDEAVASVADRKHD